MKKIYKINTSSWYIERLIFLIGGIFIITSVVFTIFISFKWLILTSLVGLMMIIFSITGYCLIAIFLQKIGKTGKCNR